MALHDNMNLDELVDDQFIHSSWGHLPSEAKASKTFNIRIFVWN